MPVSVEWLRHDVGLLRGGKDHHEYGDPYDSVMVVDGIGSLAVLKGLVSKKTPSKSDWVSIRKLLKLHGFVEYEIERRSSTGELTKRVRRDNL